LEVKDLWSHPWHLFERLKPPGTICPNRDLDLTVQIGLWHQCANNFSPGRLIQLDWRWRSCRPQRVYSAAKLFQIAPSIAGHLFEPVKNARIPSVCLVGLGSS
jgi:hypothetical protein